MSVPPFYPDQAKPFLAQAEAEKLFAKLDRIFLETGCPPFPLMLAAFPVIIIWAIVNFSATTWYIQISIPVTFESLFCLFLYFVYFIYLSILYLSTGWTKKKGDLKKQGHNYSEIHQKGKK